MLEMMSENAAEIILGLFTSGALSLGITSFIKIGKAIKEFFKVIQDNKKEIEVTKEGISEALKAATITPEWKISINDKIDEKLEAWAEKFLVLFEEHEIMRTQLMAANTQILAYTSAFKKLTSDEQETINGLLLEATGKVDVIEV